MSSWTQQAQTLVLAASQGMNHQVLMDFGVQRRASLRLNLLGEVSTIFPFRRCLARLARCHAHCHHKG